MTIKHPTPLALIILDGWGHRDHPQDNAIAAAHKPYWDHLLKTYPHTLISGSGRCVGLPEGQMGNSEVGHLNMGAGRIVYQDLTRIDAAIEQGDFFTNEVLIQTIQSALKQQKAIHVMGLLSPGGVHSHEQHLHALVKLAAQYKVPKLYIHAFLDGRDTPPRSALTSLQALQAHCQALNCGKIVSIIGRYYAMDRDKRWDRLQKAYELIVDGKADYHADTIEEAIQQAYARGENDEFVQATTIGTPVLLQDQDDLIFMNFRADRAREITQAFVEPEFTGFKRTSYRHLHGFVCLSEYDKRFPVAVAFPPIPLTHLFGEYISEQGFTQLRIAETEKYAHVTFFFNGGIETPAMGEERILIPSPAVGTYDLQPEMSAPQLTERLIQEIKTGRHQVIICNFANADMVGHTGNFAATVKAIETLDQCLAKIIPALQQAGGEALITADHGNAELMFDCQTNQAHTAHTTEEVPLIYVGRPATIAPIKGRLSDIAPTLLTLLGLPVPAEMTGQSLVKLG